MKRFVWLVLTLLIVAALVLTSCQAATEEGKEGTTVKGQVTEKEAPKVEEEEEEAVVEEEKGPEMVRNIHGNLVEKPQYGGTIRYRVFPSQSEHFDPLWWDANNMQSIVNDRMMTAMWEKGPEGSQEHPLNYSYYAENWFRGELLESWEMHDLYHVTFKIREGIHFWDKPPVNGRELTVDDVLWSWIRGFVTIEGVSGQTGPEMLGIWNEHMNSVSRGAIPEAHIASFWTGLRNDWKPTLERIWPGAFEILKERWVDAYERVEETGFDVDDIPLFYTYIRKIDDYTLELIDFDGEYNLWNNLSSMWILPREVIEEYGNFDDWRTLVTTGPWIPTDYVRDSSASFRKNPDYWQDDPNLPGNQLPYADRLLVLSILDQATYLAALRTAKLDIGNVVWHKVDSFKETSPEMLHVATLPTQSHTISVRTDIPPFDDIRVRQAAMLAIDQPSMLNDFYEGNAYLFTWPLQESFTEVYTQPEDLPEDIQELYQYHPDKARELLTEAGYPNGFKTKLYVYPSADDRESCLVMNAYLQDVGIDAEFILTETASFVEILYGGEYEHMISCWWGNNFPTDAWIWAEGGEETSPYNFSNVVDIESNELAETWSRIADADERNRILKEHSVKEMRQCYNLIIPIPVNNLFWWPWLKNYSGQTDLGYPDETGWGEIPKYIWIDQDLKYEIAGTRD